MQFRVAHLLIVMVLVALFGTALAVPNDLSRGLVNLGAWFAYITLAVRAIVRPTERPILVSALIVGLSYLMLAAVLDTELATGRLLASIGYAEGLNYVMTDSTQTQNYVPNFIRIGHIAFSFIFAFIGAAVAAYWSRPHTS
jgi:hypothetical protein